MKNVWGLSDSYKNSRSKPEGQAAKPSIAPSSWVIKQSPGQRTLQLLIASSSFLVNIFLILNATFFFSKKGEIVHMSMCVCNCLWKTPLHVLRHMASLFSLQGPCSAAKELPVHLQKYSATPRTVSRTVWFPNLTHPAWFPA